ncbi:MAG: site-specific integrase [Acidobacteria bacterium]|nr:site-specific integrase [Acidobacteriota bacterium]
MARKGDGIFKRGSVWRLDCYINGQRYQVSLGKGITRTRAQEIASVKRAAILRGEVGIGRKKKDIPFDTAVESFLAAVKGNIRANTYRSYETCLESIGELFKGKKLSDISPFLIESWKKQRKETAPVAFNRELGTLKTLVNWCIDNGKFEGANPTGKVKRLQESHGRDRALEPEEEQRLLDECREPLRTILLCGIDAGLRIPSETLWLKKSDIDLRNNLVTVQAAFSKNGKTESVPLTPRLRAALKKMLSGHQQSEYLFNKEDGTPFKTIQNIFRSAAKRAGITDISPHVMRHTFATRLDQAGVSLRTIQELGRWADIRMVQRYSNPSDRNKREAIERLSENSTSNFTTPANTKVKSFQTAKALNDGSK